MKSTLLLLLLVCSQRIFAQTFVEAPQAPPFEGVAEGSIAFADIDGDNDLDVLITGRDSSSTIRSKLYTNDGMGNFTEMMGTPFEGVVLSSIGFADVDGDNDQDVLITGTSSSGVISKLYTNDGMGNFTEMLGTPFTPVRSSFIAFADIDGDNDQDVLITGRSSAISAPRSSRLYTNDGLGNFTLVSGTPFLGVSSGSISFGDIDSDNDLDVLLTGFITGGARRTASLYINDGLGNFTSLPDTIFAGVSVSSSAIADVDDDNDQDVLIGGFGSGGPITKLYINDGTANFTESTPAPFDSINAGSVAFEDVDGDNDPDVLITGRNNSNMNIAKLYINDSLGNFNELLGTPFEGVSSSSFAFADVDGDDDQDVLIIGADSSGLSISKLYLNEGIANSIDELSLSLSFTVFPNPSTHSTLFLSYDSKETAEINIKVYTLKGVLIMQQKEFAVTGEQMFSIDISRLIKGIYILEIDNGKGKGLSKFVVQSKY